MLAVKNTSSNNGKKTKAEAAPKTGATPSVDHTKPHVQLNLLWHSLATHVNNVQTKLTVGTPNDEYEQEADNVADKVMRMPADAANEKIEDPPTIQSKPIHVPAVQRLCAECEEELGQGGKPTVQKKASGFSTATPVSASVNSTINSPGAGSPLNDSVRSRIEPVLGADLSSVRVHSGAQAQDASRSLNAKSFTNQNNIFLGRGQSSSDIQLMAHETTHTLQQGALPQIAGGSSTIQRKPSAEPETESEAGTGAAGAGRAVARRDCDNNESNPIIWFEHNSTTLRSSGGINSVVHLMLAIRRAQAHITAAGPTARVYLYGYASEEGGEVHNATLAQQRADTIKSLMASAGIASANLHATGLGEDTSMGARPLNRRVEICPTPSIEYIDMPPETITPDVPKCSHPTTATSLTQFAFLVRCLEGILSATHGPVGILRTLRELYYGGARFDSAACGDSESGTITRLNLTAPALMTALRGSKVTAGVDVGHIFTGLEGMLCPRRRTSAAWYAPSVNMSNEDFLTWGGDIGSAAAGRLRGYNDSGWVFKTAPPWSNYFLTSGSLASREDLLGDIDAFVMRANIKGVPCASTKDTRMPSPSTPISRLFLEFYGAPPGMASGLTSTDRFKCFAEAAGGSVSGTSITNILALVSRYAPQVYSFAHLFYLGMRKHHLFTISLGDIARLLRYAEQITRRFFNWIERNL